MDEASLFFDFYGVSVDVQVDDAEVRRRVENDFSHFQVDALDQPASLQIRGSVAAPDYGLLPPLKAQVYSPRNICYPDGPLTYIDYFGKALAIYDRERFSVEAASEDIHLLHEIIFLTMISRVNEKLEDQGLHRVHALAVESGGEAALFMMPSGGGKTTLARKFLESDDDCRIVSEDSPIISSAGLVLPYPLRFGVVGEKPAGIAEHHLTYMRRMEFEPKYLISLDAFQGRIARAASEPRFLFLGDRTLGLDCVIHRVGFWMGLKSLMRHMVVGVGLYQGVEFILQSSSQDLLRGSGRFLSRLRRAVTLARRSQVYALELGRDPQHNFETIQQFFLDQGFTRPKASTRNLSHFRDGGD